MASSKHVVAVVAVGLAAGCGGEEARNRDPVVIDDSNTALVAAAALSSPDRFADTSILLGGAVGQGPLARLMAQTPAPGPAFETEACAFGGTTTSTPSTTGGTITFHDCSDSQGIVVNGTLTLGVAAGSLSARFSLTIVAGTMTVIKRGSYELLPRSESGAALYEIRGDEVTASYRDAGVTVEDEALLDFDLIYRETLTTPYQLQADFTYALSSQRLGGLIEIETPELANRDPEARFPHSGRAIVTGASDTRLEITIHGDEDDRVPDGQGQLELRLDPGTGTLGTSTWLSWSDLPAYPTPAR